MIAAEGAHLVVGGVFVVSIVFLVWLWRLDRKERKAFKAWLGRD